MIYELWSTTSRNLVAAFDDREAAMAFVRDMRREHGAEYVAGFALASEDRAGRSRAVAVGEDLVELARARSEESDEAPVALARPA